MDMVREMRISETGHPYADAADLVDHIMETASDIVTENCLAAGIAPTAARFTQKLAETAAAMVTRICEDAVKAGRPQIARAVLAAWDAAA